jgi:hypothetical protein
VEISATETHLFPYQQMVTASLVRENDHDVVHLAFSSHDIEITGRNLRDLLVGLQDFAVKWLRALPHHYQQMLSGDTGSISSIRIKPV